MNDYPSPREIQRWYPSKWNEIAGNGDFVRTWKNFILNGLCNSLFTGPSRFGKTRTITLGVRSVLCTERTETLDPCGKCGSCIATMDGRSPHSGVFAAMTGSEYCFQPIDCENIRSDEVDELRGLVDLESERTIIYLDEVAALRRRGLEGKLLKWIDEMPAIWIASAISLKRQKGSRKGEWKDQLSREMRSRFAIKVGASVPHPSDLYEWIEARSDAWNIRIDDPEATIPMMIERTGCCVGCVNQLFAYAATITEREIRLEDVVGFNFDTED